MKINPSGLTPGQTANNQALAISQITGNEVTLMLRRFTTNLGSTSPAFRENDNLIVALDGTYNELPSGPVTDPTSKASWEAASAAWAGWSVCGCKDSEPDGQTFFRCLNYLRAAQGSAIQLFAPAPGFYAATTVEKCWIATGTPDPGTNLYLAQASDDADTNIYIPNLGLGLGNPIFSVYPGEYTAYASTTPEYQAFVTRAKPGPIKWCSWRAQVIPSDYFALPYPTGP